MLDVLDVQMRFVFSPSNIMQWRTCPLKFWGQSISKLIQYKETPNKQRGIQAHTNIQQAIEQGVDSVTDWAIGMKMPYVLQLIDEVRAEVDAGKILGIEKELVVDKDFRELPDGWWDDNAYLRARADVVLLPESAEEPAFVGDIKTGRKWDNNDYQLRLEALLLHRIYGYKEVIYNYWYVDQGIDVHGSINFERNARAVADIVADLKAMGQNIKDSIFFPKKNKFCKWCDFHDTKYCEL